MCVYVHRVGLLSHLTFELSSLGREANPRSETKGRCRQGAPSHNAAIRYTSPSRAAAVASSSVYIIDHLCIPTRLSVQCCRRAWPVYRWNRRSTIFETESGSARIESIVKYSFPMLKRPCLQLTSSDVHVFW